MNKKAYIDFSSLIWGLIIGLIIGVVLMYLYLNNMLPIEPLEILVP